jgi:alpha-amylase/alpha-mannosidase (GH57 family)
VLHPHPHSEFLDRYPPREEVDIHPGAWNTGHHWGGDFAQWTGSLLQKKGWDQVRDASDFFQKVKRACDSRYNGDAGADEIRRLIARAYDHILMAETSCNFYWGSRWVHRSYDQIEKAYSLLDSAVAAMQ